MFHCELESLSRYSDSLLAERSGDQIPIAAKFSVPVRTDTRGRTILLYKGYHVIRGLKAAGTWILPLTLSAIMPSSKVNCIFYVSILKYQIKMFFSQYKLCILM
jgi:hypothetical protein